MDDYKVTTPIPQLNYANIPSSSHKQFSFGGTLVDQDVELSLMSAEELRKSFNDFISCTQSVVTNCPDDQAEEVYKICHRVLAGLRKHFNKLKKNSPPALGKWDLDSARFQMEAAKGQFVASLITAKKEFDENEVGEEAQKIFLTQLAEAFAPARTTVRNIRNRFKNVKNNTKTKGASE